MVTFSQQIEDAIKVVQGKQVVFTATDVAEYAGLDGSEIRIAPVLQKHCGNGELLNLDGRHSPNRRYMRQVTAERWWVKQTLRWAELGLNYLTPEQLAGAMSLTFGEPRWAEPPQSLLAVGRQWAMVDDGCVPGTYVSPWASVLRANPHLKKRFCIIFNFGVSPYGWADEVRLQEKWGQTWNAVYVNEQPESFIDLAVKEALDQLTDREAEIVRRRLGITTGTSETLEQIGKDKGVTRERIRQIEDKALKKLVAVPAMSSVLFCGFAADFIRSGGSLITGESEITTNWLLLAESLELSVTPIAALEISLVAGIDGFKDYLDNLNSVKTSLDGSDQKSESSPFEPLRFLSYSDGMRLGAAEKKYLAEQELHLAEQCTKTLPRMLYQGLRSLGHAAHYEEIAKECNRLFPQRENTARNWHSCLGYDEAKALGIVWIGRRGMYGLKEHGYTRPPRGIFDAATSIVEARFAETGRPVPEEFVIAELMKERQYLHPNSATMALTLNKKLTSTGNRCYIPKEPDSISSEEGYDMDAGFEAL